MRAVVLTVTGTGLSFPELARLSMRYEGAGTHRLVVHAGERKLTLPETWTVEPTPECLAVLRKNVTRVEVVETYGG